MSVQAGTQRVESFLSSQESERESTELQGSTAADLNGDGREEIVFVWTLLGPTYWRNSLTVLSKTENGYRAVASLKLMGEAKLAFVKDGVVFVNQKVYRKGDPICCPSLSKQLKYRWRGNKIVELKE